MLSPSKLISLVIPVHNGEQTITELVVKLVFSLQPRHAIEIVLVNDGSTDRSEEACLSLFRRFPDMVKFYSLAKNVGEHNAVIAGLNQSRGDHMVIMDDDFQNPISEVMKLIDFALEHDDDVVYTYYITKRHGFLRNLGSRLHNGLANVLLKKPKGLYLSSFKCVNRFLVDEIVKYDLSFPHIDGLILRTTEKIGRIEVEHHPRQAGKSGYTLKKLIRLWLNSFTAFSILPLRISLVIGLIFSMAGFLLGVVTIIEKISNPHLPMGYTLIIVILTLFLGVLLISLGVIGEYVGRIYLAQSKKPQFTIRKRFEKTPPSGDHEKT
ncbi:MAG: glycosyltransferase [Candidatus Aminicenantes bacterium]|nr:glycosyltransferase [Candidatus Aminicenantes bacterium]